jgi:hypothetical protein
VIIENYTMKCILQAVCESRNSVSYLNYLVGTFVKFQAHMFVNGNLYLLIFLNISGPMEANFV